MQKKKCKLLLVLAASSLFALSSCGHQDVSSSSVDSKEPTSSVSSQEVKTYYAVTLTTGEHYTIEAVTGYTANKVEKGKEFKFKVVAKEAITSLVSKLEIPLLPEKMVSTLSQTSKQTLQSLLKWL